MRLRRAIRHNSSAELPRSTARIQTHMSLAIIVVRGVMASVRSHRSEQLNVQHMDMSANTATNATTPSPYVAAGQLGERTVKTTQRRHSSPSVP